MTRTAGTLIIDASMSITGALKAANNIAKCLATEGHVTLALPEGSSVTASELSDVESLVHFPMVQLRKSVYAVTRYLPSLLATSIQIRRFVAENNVQLVILNDMYLMHGTMLRALGYKGRIVTWVRIDPARFPKRLSQFWLKAASWSSNTIVAVSEFIRERLGGFGIEASLVYDCVSPHGGDLRPGVVGSGKAIVAVGNYIPGKGQDDAIHMVKRLVDRHPDVKLRFFGSDMNLQNNKDYVQRLRGLISESELSNNVEVNGFSHDLLNLYQGARLALVLSHSESFSFVCLEACQFGVPVIAYRSGGPSEIVRDGVTGFLCDVGDVSDVVCHVDQLLADAELANTLGRNAQEDVMARFSWGSFASAVYQVTQAKQLS